MMQAGAPGRAVCSYTASRIKACENVYWPAPPSLPNQARRDGLVKEVEELSSDSVSSAESTSRLKFRPITDPVASSRSQGVGSRPSAARSPPGRSAESEARPSRPCPSPPAALPPRSDARSPSRTTDCRRSSDGLRRRAIRGSDAGTQLEILGDVGFGQPFQAMRCADSWRVNCPGPRVADAAVRGPCRGTFRRPGFDCCPARARGTRSSSIDASSPQCRSSSTSTMADARRRSSGTW